MQFRRRPGRSWGKLVTAVVAREDERWTISYWVDAGLKAGENFDTLDALVRTGDALVRDSYPAGEGRATAELQYAIYPWKFKGQPEVMLDVTGDAHALTASDISGTTLGFSARTADDLVEQASRLVEQPRVMLRWVKKVSGLRGAE